MRSLFFALLALAPGAVAWWTGRRLARLTDDPALPELLLNRRQRLATVAATSIAVTVVLGGRAVYWAMPLMAVAAIVGGYPLRRTIALESGGFVRYLWRGIKSIIGGLGFWVLLVLTPAIVLAIPTRYQILALTLLALLIAWEEWYPRIWLRLHDAVPLVNAELTPRIEAIVRRAGIAAPELYAIGARGSRLVNAFAFPSIRRPAIALGAALVELLEPDEAAAIYAHELSHIEQHGPRRIRRWQAVTRLLIALSVALPLVLQRFAPSVSRWAVPVWPVIVLLVLAVRTRRRQHEEHESDLRAAALCGDAEVVARALIKVHVHALLPRRWPIDFERRASHPSLARRVQALRGDAAQAPEPSVGPTILSTAREGTIVVFDDARAYWFDGVPEGTPASLDALRDAASSMRSVAWPELVELRVAANHSERTLRATHRNGDSWQVPLAPAQVGEVQRALDRIDSRLHRELGTSPRRTPQLLAALVVLAAMLAADVWLLLVPAMLALFRPSTAALGALGAMAVARAIGALTLDPESLDLGIRAFGIAALGVAGIAAVVASIYRVRRERKRDGVRLTLLVLGVLTALLGAMGVVAASQLSVVELADSPFLPALAVTLLGLGVACVTVGSRWGKAAAGVAGVLAILTGGGQKIARLRLPSAPKLIRLSANAKELERVQLVSGYTGLRLSPDGTRFLVQHYDEREASRTRPSWRHVVGTFGGQRREIEAVQVEFSDEVNVLALRKIDEGLELRLESADRDSTIWSAPLPMFDEAKLVTSPRERTWTLVGYDNTSDSLLVITGTVASPQGIAHRFAELDSLNGTEHLVFDGGSTLLVPVFSARRSVSMPLAMFGLYPLHTDLWQVTATTRRAVGTMNGFPTCGSPDHDRTVCFTRRRNGSELWLLDPSGTMTPLGAVSGLDAARLTLGPGLQLTFAHSTDRVTAVDVAARRITDVRLPSASGYAIEARMADGRLVVLRQDTSSSIVTLYRVE